MEKKKKMYRTVKFCGVGNSSFHSPNANSLVIVFMVLEFFLYNLYKPLQKCWNKNWKAFIVSYFRYFLEMSDSGGENKNEKGKKNYDT